MRIAFLFTGLCFAYLISSAQDPEFPKNEFIMHIKLHSGLVTNFHAASPDVNVSGIQLVPQFTVIENHLRVGAIADVFYTAKKIQGAIGPTASLKLTTFDLKGLGSGGNINLSVDHLWGTKKERLIGMGINADLLNLIVMSFSAHRDYHLNSWWFQTGFGFRISKVKQPSHP